MVSRSDYNILCFFVKWKNMISRSKWTVNWQFTATSSLVSSLLRHNLVVQLLLLIRLIPFEFRSDYNDEKFRSEKSINPIVQSSELVREPLIDRPIKELGQQSDNWPWRAKCRESYWGRHVISREKCFPLSLPHFSPNSVHDIQRWRSQFHYFQGCSFWRKFFLPQISVHFGCIFT